MKILVVSWPNDLWNQAFEADKGGYPQTFLRYCPAEKAEQIASEYAAEGKYVQIHDDAMSALLDKMLLTS